jgi:hypothetical protein
MGIIDDILGVEAKVKPATINQKQKGNINERACAKALSKWTGSEMIRVPSSGGRRLSNNILFVGDITCGDLSFDFPFVVETKHLSKLTFRFDNKNNNFKSLNKLHISSSIRGIMQQCIADCERTDGKKPLILIRENGMPAGCWYALFQVDALTTSVETYGDSIHFYVVERGKLYICIPSSKLFSINYENFKISAK